MRDRGGGRRRSAAAGEGRTRRRDEGAENKARSRYRFAPAPRGARQGRGRALGAEAGPPPALRRAGRGRGVPQASPRSRQPRAAVRWGSPLEERFRRVDRGGRVRPASEGETPNSRRQGAPREASGSWDRAFPPISAPARPPRPACPPSGITPLPAHGGGRARTAGGRGPAGGGGGARGEAGGVRGPGGLGPLAGEAHAGGGHGDGDDARAGDGGVCASASAKILCEAGPSPQRPLGPAGGAGFAAGRDRRVRDTPKDPPRPPRPPGPGRRRRGPAIPIILIARLLNTSARQQNLSSPRLPSVEPRGGDCIRRRDGMGNR